MRAPAKPESAARQLAPAVAESLLTSGQIEADTLGTRNVVLRPGDWLFGSGALRVSTVLGCSIALVLWAPRRRLGAVCHCLLPTRPADADADVGDAQDGRYGADAVQWLAQRFAEAQCPVSEFEVSLAGGALGSDDPLALANVAWAQRWVQQQGLDLVQQDVGGRVVRRLTFNLADGSLTLAHGGRLSSVG